MSMHIRRRAGGEGRAASSRPDAVADNQGEH
jgi:hypothetical protein